MMAVQCRQMDMGYSWCASHSVKMKCDTSNFIFVWMATSQLNRIAHNNTRQRMELKGCVINDHFQKKHWFLSCMRAKLSGKIFKEPFALKTVYGMFV